MLTLEKSIKVLKLNRKPTGNYRTLKEGDILTIKFDCTGHGGNSPKVDLYINHVYVATPFARSVNAELFKPKTSWRRYTYVEIPNLLGEYEEVN